MEGKNRLQLNNVLVVQVFGNLPSRWLDHYIAMTKLVIDLHGSKCNFCISQVSNC